MKFQRALTWLITFSMLSTFTLSPYSELAAADVAELPPFTDTKGHWAEKTILKWNRAGLAEGYRDGTFKPNQRITRAEFTALINRKMNLDLPVFSAGFVDIDARDWYYRDIALGKAAGYITGYEDGTFMPNRGITRQEAAVITERWMDMWQPEEPAETAISFTDSSAFKEWSASAILSAASHRIVDGYEDRTFRPGQPITRAEALVVIERLASLYDEDTDFRAVNRGVQYEEIDYQATSHPIVAITSPTAGSAHYTASSTVTIKGQANAQASWTLAYSTDDGRTGEVEGLGQWEIPALTLLQSSTKITITLTDDQGRSSSDTLLVVKDQAKPQLIMNSAPPSGTIYTTKPTIAINGFASDDKKLDRVTYRNDDEVDGSERVAEGLEKWLIPSLSLVPGRNRITVKAIDAAGHTVEQQVDVVYNEEAVLAGDLKVSQEVLFVDESADVLFTIPVEGAAYAANAIHLHSVQADGTTRAVGVMNDDGNLYHGDDIGGDDIFSIYLPVGAAQEEQLHYQAVLKTDEGYVSSQVVTIKIVQRSTAEERSRYVQFREHLQAQAGNPTAAIIDWLQEQPDIASAGISPNGGSIWYKTEQGLTGGLLTSEAGTKGALTGQVADASAVLDTVVNDQDSNIASANVLIVSPFAAKGLSSKAYDDLAETFRDTLQFNVSHLKNDAANVEAFKELSRYGVVVFDTHGELVGSESEAMQVILTGEKVTAANLAEYEADLQAGLLIDVNGYYAITPAFIAMYNQSLPNSLIYNGSCLSMNDDQFANAFLSLGARSYLGYTDYIKVADDQTIVTQFFQALIKKQQAVGEAYNAISESALAGSSMFKLVGSGDLMLQTQFFSTSFEEGKVEYWTSEGDVRVVSKLGSIYPTHGEYMALMSTGVGAVENVNSSIRQTVEIPEGVKSITMDYNLISEEPMEWVDSEYDDHFKVTLIDPSNQSETVAMHTISQSDWHADPDINLDGGDSTAYMTGWRSVSADVSDFAGIGAVQIQIEVVDEGDSEYDTVVLLDNVKVSYLHALDPTDTDGDGIPDELELQGIRIGYNGKYVTTVMLDPYNYDTDDDGLSDGAELLYLNYYNQASDGFYEAIDHPNSDMNSEFTKDIHADLEQIIDVHANTIEAYTSNIIKAEQYKTDLLEYSNKIVSYMSDISMDDRSGYLAYSGTVRALVSALNQSIADYAGYILNSSDEAAIAWLMSSNISLMDTEFGEGEVANPLHVNGKIGIENYRDDKVYQDDGPLSGGLDYEQLTAMTSKELQALYAQKLQELPITPYESYEYVMNAGAFEQLLGYMDIWWMFNSLDDEESRNLKYWTAIEALQARNNPCSYLPDGCGDGTASFKQFYDRYFFIEHTTAAGDKRLYAVEADLGVLSAAKMEHVVYALVEPSTSEVRYIGRTSSPDQKRASIQQNLKYAGLEWKELYRGTDYEAAKKAEQAEFGKYASSDDPPKLLIGVRSMTDKATHIAAQLRSVRGDLELMQEFGPELSKGLWKAFKKGAKYAVIGANLIAGIGLSIVNSLKDFFSVDVQLLIDLVEAIADGDIKANDMISALGSSISEPFKYLYNNGSDIIKGKASAKKARTYGEKLGEVLQMIAGVITGGGAAVTKVVAILKKASKELGEKLEKKLKKNGSLCNCFTAGTMVLTDEGEKPIEEIAVGDKVLAKSEYDSNGELAYKEVTALYRNQRDDIIKLYVGEQVIETTDNHPFWVEGRGWVFADELQAGDKLQKADGSNLTIDKVEFVKLEKPVTVYNFTVADFHTYYVTDFGIWVHNTNCPTKAQPHVVVNALSNFQSSQMKFGSHTFLLDKSGMKHILERHHPNYWDGSVKAQQSFFDARMSIDDITSAIKSVMSQNRDILASKGTKGMYQITGTYNGKDYVLGLNNGRVGQFYSP